MIPQEKRLDWMIDRLTDKLSSLYHFSTNEAGIKTKSLDDFLKLIYLMDVNWIKRIGVPFIWEDYIFIDDYIFKKAIDSNIDYDHLCDFDIEIIKSLNLSDIKNFKYKFPINHFDFIDDTSKDYYSESKENYFLLHDYAYNEMLIRKRRNLGLSKLID